ncbi:hypothetical protein [Aquihabitans sp. McL0605]|uniref:hypothetical protein n=1 Tax=Aquihabitans sp. McL0605 TaxID=3415671 RepID=UPI003CE72E9D
MVTTRARAPRATDPQADPGLEPGSAAAPPRAGHPRRTAGFAVILVSLVLVCWPGATLWMVLAAGAVALSVGLPLTVADSPGLARRLVPVAVIVLSLLSGWAAYARANGSGSIRDRSHDGGVIVTRAAADDLAHLRNPYTADFTGDLPRSWLLVEGNDGAKVANPVAHHFPYLPAAALVHTPFVAGANAVGLGWDTRILGWLVLVGALVALARRPEPAWLRLGAICGLGGPFTLVYLSWGTNDLMAVALAVLALCWADRRPRLAGFTLALALSVKVLLAVLIPPLAVVVVLTGGWAALRRWWTLPATLLVTCLPFLAASPSAFLDDTVWFNLGRSKPLMPTSGIGLPATSPGLFHGPLLGLLTVLGLVLALVLPILAVRRWPSVWTAGASAGVGLLCVLVPARTFQTNYLVLVASLLPLAWLALAAAGADGPPGASDQAGIEPAATASA